MPTDTRGKPRVDDRRVISGIIHVLKFGDRWVDAPADYGPKKTLYNRYVRWAAKRGGSANLLETYDLGRRLFEEVHRHLEANGLKVSTGTIVDAAIITLEVSSVGSRKRQTSTAAPAEPGELPNGLAVRSIWGQFSASLPRLVLWIMLGARDKPGQRLLSALTGFAADLAIMRRMDGSPPKRTPRYSGLAIHSRKCLR